MGGQGRRGGGGGLGGVRETVGGFLKKAQVEMPERTQESFLTPKVVRRVWLSVLLTDFTVVRHSVTWKGGGGRSVSGEERAGLSP